VATDNDPGPDETGGGCGCGLSSPVSQLGVVFTDETLSSIDSSSSPSSSFVIGDYLRRSRRTRE